MVANRSLSVGSGLSDSVKQFPGARKTGASVRNRTELKPSSSSLSSATANATSTGGGSSRSSWSLTSSNIGEGHLMTDFSDKDGVANKRKSNAATHLNASVTSRKTLHQMAREGDINGVRRYLEEFDTFLGRTTVKPTSDSVQRVNQLNSDQLTPLHYASRYNHYEMVQLLVEKGADVKIKSEDGLTPLHFAARYKHRHQNEKPTNIEEENEKSIQTGHLSMSDDLIQATFFRRSNENENASVIVYLVSRGAEVNCKDSFGMTALHYSVRGNVKAARELIRCKGINVEARDAENMTPLHLASVHGNVAITKLLIEAGANPRSRDESHATPLLRAAAVGNLDIVRLLLESTEQHDGVGGVTELLTDQDSEGNTALHLATENGHKNVVQYLVTNGADVNLARQKQVFPLHLAAAAGDVQSVAILLKSKAFINCLNANQETPLHRATEFNRVDVMDLLLSKGADIDRRDKSNLTPFLKAASNGHTEAIECLLKHQVDSSAKDKDDKTAIHLAAQQNNRDALIALLNDPRSEELLCRPDRFGNSPLHVSAGKGYLQIIQCLLERGCPIELKNDEEQTALHLACRNGKIKIVKEFVRHNKLMVNSEDENGQTALHLAALAGHDQVIKILVEAGANIDSRDGHLWTPLDCASSNGHINSVRILLEAGSVIDTQDKSKTTSLHLAAATGSVEVVVTLLECGADVSLRDDVGRNCLEIAIDNSRKDVASAIVQSEFWEKALRSERYTDDGLKVTPLRMLIRKMPDVAEEVFVRCTETNQLPTDHPLYTVKFHYELLDDTYVTFDSPTESSSRRSSEAQNTSGIKDVKLVKRNDYSQYGNLLKENHPLIIMVRSRRQKLLAHPLCVSLLHLKWISFGRYVYYVNLLLYLIFLAFLSAYILSIPPPIRTDDPNYDVTVNTSEDTTETTHLSVCELPNAIVKRLDLKPTSFQLMAKPIIIALAIFHLIKEILQLYMVRLNYFSLENLMEWACYTTTLLLVIDFSQCSYETGIREVWQWQVGAAAIFLAWVNLVLFISKFPYLGLYVVMFSDVCRTFCKVGIVFFFMFVAFAFSYHTVMYYEEPFNNAAKSIVRVVVMMLMEFQFDDLYHDNDLLYPIPAYILFILTITVVSLIIMNLLIGLSVNEIKMIQATANLKRLAMQVELVLNVEAVLPRILQERFVIRERSFLPNQRKRTFFRKMFTKLNNTQALKEALASPQKILDSSETPVIYHCRESEMDQIQEKQNYLMTRARQMTESIDNLRNENQTLQNILTTILRHQGVRYEDDDELT